MGDLEPKRGSDFDYVPDPPLVPYFMCNLCNFPAYLPVQSPCEHLFCEHCIAQQRQSTGDTACPTCGHQSNEPWQPAPKYVVGYLGSLMVKCRRTHESGGRCGAVFQREQNPQHSKVCEYRKIACPQRCGQMFYRGELRQHEITCPAASASPFQFKAAPPPADVPAAPETPSKPMWTFNASSTNSSPSHDAPNMDVDPDVPTAAGPMSPPSVQQTTPADVNSPFVLTTKFPGKKGVRKARTAGAAAVFKTRPQTTPQPNQQGAYPQHLPQPDAQVPPQPTAPTMAPQPANPAPDAPTGSDAAVPPTEPPAPQAPPATHKTTARAPSPTGIDAPPAPPAAPLAPKEERRRTASTSAEAKPAAKPAEAQPPQPAAEEPKRMTSKKLKMQADDLYEAGKYDDAIAVWGQAINAALAGDNSTKLAVVYGNRSAAHFMSLQYPQCVADCRSALETDPHNEKLWSRMAKATHAMGNLSGALDILKQALKNTNGRSFTLVRSELELCENVQAALKRCQAYLEQRKHVEAQSVLGQIDKAAEAWPEVLLVTAQTLSAAGQHPRAADLAERVIAACLSKPSSLSQKTFARAYLVKANVMYSKGFSSIREAMRVAEEGMANVTSEARQTLVDFRKKCLQIEESKSKGNEAFKKQDWAQSDASYTQGLQLCMDCSECAKVLYTNRAAARKEMKQLKKAVEDCGEALKLDEGFQRAYTRRGRCFMELNDYEKAVADFKKALQYGADSDVEKLLQDAKLRRDSKPDYYTLLGVARGFDGNDEKTLKGMKKKYQQLCMRWHPDKVQGGVTEREDAEKKFKEITEAYQTLTDPERRRQYDRKLPRSGGYTRSNTYNPGGYEGYAYSRYAGANAHHPHGPHHGFRGYGGFGGF